MSIALYLHLPFCRQKCVYCDFASFAGQEAAIAPYCDALERELRQAAERLGRRTVHSVFFGGGTPTLLPAAQIARLLDAARGLFEFRLGAEMEITMEGNPGTLNESQVRGYRAAGVNRFSLGAQAAQPHLLRALGRIHRWADVEQGMAMLRAAGFENVNLDLMFGLPGQTCADWQETLRAALALSPEHLSCYSLQVEEGTPLAAQIEAGAAPALPTEEDERAMYADARRLLADTGFTQYEISNFARLGRECRQNITYWTRGEYLGLGSAAHSLMGERRWGNVPSLSDYLATMEREDSPIAEESEIAPEEARFEAVMLGLRLTEGIEARAFKTRYGISLEWLWGTALHSLAADGLVAWTPERLCLTERGLDLQNVVLRALMKEQQEP